MSWKKKYGGLMPSEVRKLRQLEEENVRLRRLVADCREDARHTGIFPHIKIKYLCLYI